MMVVLIQRGHLDTDKHTRRRPCEDKGRDWGDAAEATEHHILPVNHQKLGEKPGADFSLRVLRRKQPC